MIFGDPEAFVKCPHCGHDDTDDRYLGEGCYELECGNCGGTYTCAVSVSVTYKTGAEAAQ